MLLIPQATRIDLVAGLENRTAQRADDVLHVSFEIIGRDVEPQRVVLIILLISSPRSWRGYCIMLKTLSSYNSLP